MQFKIFPYRLYFKSTFRIAHTERNFTDNAYILIQTENNFGWGECVFVPYYSETLETLTSFFSRINLPQDTKNIGLYINDLLNRHHNNTFSIAALDIALHNLHTSITGQSISVLYGLLVDNRESSFTIGISTHEEMQRKINENPDVCYYKLKVNEKEINRIIETYIKLSNKPFTVDANQGFLDKNAALYWSKKLGDYGAYYFEQPFHKDDLESHKWLKNRSQIPIVADESFQTFTDIERIGTYFDGLNVKLMKCGGIYSGIACLKKIREIGLKSVLGCMSESSVANNAAVQISSLSDWVDLDGPKLIINDHFNSNKSKTELIHILGKYECL
jgi:L-Ala-D/L-Glu epimerase